MDITMDHNNEIIKLHDEVLDKVSGGSGGINFFANKHQ